MTNVPRTEPKPAPHDVGGPFEPGEGSTPVPDDPATTDVLGHLDDLPGVTETPPIARGRPAGDAAALARTRAAPGRTQRNLESWQLALLPRSAAPSP